jgi:anti-sigma B factor antagonist
VIGHADAGEVDAHTAPQLARALARPLPTSHEVVVLDLSEVSFLDAAGLRILAEAAAGDAMAGVPVQLVATARAVLHPVELAGLTQLLSIHPSQDVALQAAHTLCGAVD